MSSLSLSSSQAHALFDILSHHETYSEIQQFRWPKAINEYGYPFTKQTDTPRTSPILQVLLRKYVLNLPGLKTVTPEFWKHQVHDLVEKFAEAELSESYDKGFLGSRKTLSTACSVVIEYVARGYFGKYPQKKKVDKNKQYDLDNAEDIIQGWEDFVQLLIYGDMLDELMSRIELTDQLEHHSSVVQAAHEYILVNFATFLHHIIVQSPDGAYILRVVEQVHRLIPYTVARQTLRIGNAASMINGMVKLLLTKLSVTAITNWMGWSNSPDDGMNLVQQIISTIMTWDIAEFNKKLAKLEKGPDAPSAKHISTLKEWISKSREEHEETRQKSIDTSRSIVTIIMESSSLEEPMSEKQHRRTAEYLSHLLSIRDRDQLSAVLCRHQPDLLTQAVKDCVAAYDPLIRAVHNAADLSGSLTDTENFITDLIKVSKPSGHGKEKKQPGAEDYVKLCKRHVGAVHKFLHQVAKNGPEVIQWWKDYTIEGLNHFKTTKDEPEKNEEAGDKQHEDWKRDAGHMTEALNAMFSELSEQDRSSVRSVLEEHSTYLSDLAKFSASRMKSILSLQNHTGNGPGMYLARWHDLLWNTLITPATANGAVRKGLDKDVREPVDIDTDAEKSDQSSTSIRSNKSFRSVRGRKEKPLSVFEKYPLAPDATFVISTLGNKFHDTLLDLTREGNEK